MESGSKCKVGQVALWHVEEGVRLYTECVKPHSMEANNVKEMDY